jgi:RNA polymerase sigma-70 factor, ECF subfamily
MVQQVYVGFFSSLPRLKDIDALDAFVDSITIRTVRKEIRKRKFRRLFFSRSAEIDIESAFGERPLRDVYSRTFYRMLDKLSADERTVFVLKHFEGLTTDEIAHRSGYSLRTANRRLRSGRARLKEMMMKETVLIHLLEER